MLGMLVLSSDTKNADLYQEPLRTTFPSDLGARERTSVSNGPSRRRPRRTQLLDVGGLRLQAECPCLVGHPLPPGAAVLTNHHLLPQQPPPRRWVQAADALVSPACSPQVELCLGRRLDSGRSRRRDVSARREAAVGREDPPAARKRRLPVVVARARRCRSPRGLHDVLELLPRVLLVDREAEAGAHMLVRSVGLADGIWPVLAALGQPVNDLEEARHGQRRGGWGAGRLGGRGAVVRCRPVVFTAEEELLVYHGAHGEDLMTQAGVAPFLVVFWFVCVWEEGTSA